LWAAKVLFEASFLSHAAMLFGEQSLLRFFIPTATVHPFYILLFGLLGLFGSFLWKGEAYKPTQPTMV
jgi:hypothetical protein